MGIDPAGPIFGDASHAPRLRLAKGDAHEVEVWHTNSNYLGIKRPIGDIDFYINGGSKQPDCPGVMEYCLGICSHNRGFYLLMFLMKHNKKCYGKWGCTNHNHIGDVLAKINKELTPTLTAAGCQEYPVNDYRRKQLGTLSRDGLGRSTGMVYWVQVDKDSKPCPFWTGKDIQ